MAKENKAQDLFRFDEKLFKHEFLDTSSFSVLFAKHRLDYIQSVEKYVKTACNQKKIEYTADYEECTMKVTTTKQTRDPYAIIKANDFVQLLSRGMKVEDACKVLEDEIFSTIIPTRSLCKSEKTFERRRNRLLNPKILRALELLTRCKILISGKTASIVGNYRGIEEAKDVIIGCFENVHPLFSIKKLMIKKQLMKKNKEGDWDRYLPLIKKTHSKHRKPGRASGDMPEEIKPRNEDIMRETGEYYLDQKNVEADKKREERRERIRKAREKRNEGAEE